MLAGGSQWTTRCRGYSFLPKRRRGVLVHERALANIVCDPVFTSHIPHPCPFLCLHTTPTVGLYMFIEYYRDPIRSPRERGKIVTGVMATPADFIRGPSNSSDILLGGFDVPTTQFNPNTRRTRYGDTISSLSLACRADFSCERYRESS